LVPDAERRPEQHAAVARSAALVDELLAADAILLAVPLYNWGTPASVKTWLDYLFSDPRTRDPEGLLRRRTAVLVNARGGSYQPGTPRDGWDHAEPYLRRVLAEVLGLDLPVITPELTLAEVNPALAQFIENHRASLAEAHDTAATAARELAGQLAASYPALAVCRCGWCGSRIVVGLRGPRYEQRHQDDDDDQCAEQHPEDRHRRLGDDRDRRRR
jgi:FMN-dependent NADH-azoreductase